jgi:prevent-host-death family protein
MVDSSTAWTMTAARTRFSAVIDRALTVGPQTITRHGQPAVVVLSLGDWRHLGGRAGSLAEFFAASPMPGSGLEIEPRGDLPRPIDL